MPKGELVKGDYIEETVYALDKDYKEVCFTYRIFEWFEFPRGVDFRCAFCQGDPCAEKGQGLIALYREVRGDQFETCPVCGGRAP